MVDETLTYETLAARSIITFFQNDREPIKVHIFGKLLSRAFQKYIVSRAHHRSGKSYSELKLVISEITSYFISGTLHLIKKINEYITVSNNDRQVFRFSLTPSLKNIISHSPSNACNSTQRHRRPMKVYIFEEISIRTFQKYIVLHGFDHYEQSYDLSK